METNPHTPPASFIDLMMDAVFAVDNDSRIVFVSAACERIFGYTPHEMIGMYMYDLVAPEDRDSTRQSAQEVMSGLPQLHFENRYIRKDGQLVHLMWSARWSPADRLRIGVARDITERKRAEAQQAALYAISEAAHAAEDLAALFQSIHRILAKLLPAANFSVALYDEREDRLSFPYRVDEREQPSTAPQPAAGTLCAEVIRRGQPLLLVPATIAELPAGLRAAVGADWLCWLGVPLKSQKGTIGVLALKSYAGGVHYGEKDQELLQFVSTQIAAAIERQQLQARLQRMAQYDWLTDLPNRGLLHDRLKTALARARRERSRLALLYLDLDKFKQVNDRYGHAAGDRLLQEVALRLTQCVRASDTVARLGGDEFVVLLENLQAPADATQLADKIRAAISQPLDIDGHQLRILPSIGIASYPEHGEDQDQLLRHADEAMYAQKKAAALG
ncbi:MAG: diguanylate cyclase [Burkholderiaceae bacterium]